MTRTRTVSKAHSRWIRRISVHNGRFATASHDKTCRIWNAENFECLATCDGHSGYVLCVALNSKFIATGSDDETVRIYDAQTFQFVRSINAHDEWINEVQLVEDGDAVLSCSSDGTIALHDVHTGQCRWRMRIGSPLYAFAVLLDGRVAVGGDDPYDVLVFPTPLRNTGVQVAKQSKLATAYAHAVTQPSVLNEKYLLAHIRAENVQTTEDVLAGHNLILLAIRVGIITPGNLPTLGNDSWHFKKNLYLPATKVNSADPAFINAIFHHAENIGLLVDGFSFAMAKEIRDDIQVGAKAVAQAFGALAQRVAALESRVLAQETDFSHLHEAVCNLHQGQQTLKSAVKALARSLTEFQTAARKHNKNRMYAGLANIMLSFIPIIGGAIGGAAYAGVEVFLGMTTEDLVKAGVDVSKAVVDEIAKVDLSNFQVAQFVFSEKELRRLRRPAKDAMMQAVSKSSFKTLDALQSELRQQIASNAKDNTHVAFLDIGASPWEAERSQTQSGGSSASGVDEFERQARHYFQYLKGVAKRENIAFAHARDGLNQMLKDCNGLEPISPREIMGCLSRISTKQDRNVSEELFVKVFNDIRGSQEREKRLQKVMEDGLRCFAESAGNDDHLELWLADRVVCGWYEDVKSDGFVESDQALSDERLEEILKEEDRNGDDVISEGEFKAALMRILGSD